jgi:DNA-directed RNA polymerase specialized sigma24 family protein
MRFLLGRRRHDIAADDGVSDAAVTVLKQLKSVQNGARGLAAPGGWVFLINDTNDFLS